MFDDTGFAIFLQNYPFGSFVYQLERIYGIPFINRKNIDKSVCMSLPIDFQNAERLQFAFEGQGLKLKKENRKIKVLVIYKA
ncbi:hypothetical protein CLV99_0624 [Sphingobacterium yanglingense]|uniref:Uncharacterized protein n=1 Tax=Sphingobacterium yanglingense TaxID=1437280 RepID=A0A4R6WKF2_9SPHI|nr:hypothetical protein CLV99_0624 [Sphingobacterium yanglingense]